MRYQVRYRCRFSYDEPAAESHNELRACPSTDERQTVLHARVVVDPSARVLTTRDYWGTRVDAFGVRLPHRTLEVTVDATVDVEEQPPLPPPVPLAALADPDFLDTHRETLVHSAHAMPDDAVRRLATEGTGDDVVALATSLCSLVEDRIEHVTGVTDVGTSVGEVLALRRGVCQDRAHLLAALCRERGIPTRYVSGYLCGGPTGADTTTHAWVEVAVPGHGWVPLDPSSDGPHDEDRIVIGRGRDYDDVPPLKGTYVGGDTRHLEVEVEIEPVTLVA